MYFTPDSLKKNHRRRRNYLVRDQCCEQLGFRSYAGYLRSSLWRQVRTLAFQKNGRECVSCGAPATQIHHSRYTIKALCGVCLKYLWPVCRKCHARAEGIRLSRDKNMIHITNRILGTTKKDFRRKCREAGLDH